MIRQTWLVMATVAAALSSGVAHSGQVAGWWGGKWSCNIDGRPARMEWRVVEAPIHSDEGDGVASQAAGVAWKGRFSDNGSGWVPLSNPRAGSEGGLFFNHSDGNKWHLGKPRGRRTDGYTTWNGQRYTLWCERQ